MTVATNATTAPSVLDRDPLLKLSRGLFYLGIAFTCILTLRVGTVTLGDVLILASLVLLGVVAAVARRGSWPSSFATPGVTTLVLTLFVFGAAVSVGNAIRPEESAVVVLRLLLLVFLLPIQARMLLQTAEQLQRAAAWLVAGATISASGAIAQAFISPTIIPGAAPVTAEGRFAGMTGHVSDMGGIAALGLAVAIGFVISSRRGKRLVAMAASAILAIGLVLSGSVSGMISVVVALLIYVLMGAIRFRSLILIVAAMGAALWLAGVAQSSVSALSPIERLLQTVGITENGRYSTLGSRTETFDVAWAIIIQNPLIGQGFDAISVSADEFSPHNILIAAWFQGGIFFALAITAMILRPFVGRWVRESRRSTISVQMVAATMSALVFSMTAPSLFNRYFWIPVALLGVARGLTLLRLRPRDVSPRR